MLALVAATLVATPGRPAPTAATRLGGTRYCVVAGCILPKNDVLNYTLADAQLMYDRLGKENSQRVMLRSDSGDTNTLPTKANLLAAIRKQAAQCGPNDSFWFYWSGHGATFAGKSYILNYDCRVSDYPSMIDVGAIRAELKACKARTKVVILDACYSGSTKAIGSNSWTELMRGQDGTITMAASDIKETALESPELGHGLFTFFLVRGLAGAASRTGSVSLGDLETYVCDGVTSFAAKKQHAQHPRFLYQRTQSAAPIANSDPAGAGPMPEAGVTVQERPRLKPGVLVLLNAETPQIAASAQSKLRAKLLENRIPLVADEQARPFLDLLEATPGEAGPVLEQWRSRYMIRGRVSSEVTELTGSMRGFFDAQITIETELIDVEGNILDVSSSDPDDQVVRAADVSAHGAVEKAMKKAIENLYKRLAGKLTGK